MTSSALVHPTGTSWRRVDARYRSYLRFRQVMGLVVALWVMALVWWLDFLPWTWLTVALLGVVLVAFVWSYGFLANRRYQRTRYAMAEWDINLQQGVLFWSQQSISFNRIQHLEVNQGPLQRLFGLASLSVYSAGTSGSDIRIPGMRFQAAQNVKDAILATINAELQEPIDAS